MLSPDFQRMAFTQLRRLADRKVQIHHGWTVEHCALQAPNRAVRPRLYCSSRRKRQAGCCIHASHCSRIGINSEFRRDHSAM